MPQTTQRSWVPWNSRYTSLSRIRVGLGSATLITPLKPPTDDVDDRVKRKEEDRERHQDVKDDMVSMETQHGHTEEPAGPAHYPFFLHTSSGGIGASEISVRSSRFGTSR